MEGWRVVRARRAIPSGSIVQRSAPPARTPGSDRFDRHEDRVAQLRLDVLREVTLTRGVLDQDDLAGPDHTALAIAGRDLDPTDKVDDVLPSRRRVPIEIVVRQR